MIIRDAFTLKFKRSLKELSPSDWLGLASSNSIVSIGKVLDGVVRIMPDEWREAVQEAEM
jgi:hypothetical protein